MSYAEDICFTEETAKRMVVDLERNKITSEQIELYKEANKELEYQVKLLKEVITLQKEQVKQYSELMKQQKEGYETVLKESKPNPFMEFIKSLGMIGIGVAIGMALAL